MAMLTPKLIVADLDGTLLDPSGQVAFETRAVLRDLNRRGILFTVATARNFSTTVELLKDLDLELPLICLNGALIFDFHKSSILRFHGMCKASSRSVIDFARENDIEMSAVMQSGKGYLGFSGVPKNRWLDKNLEQVADLSSMLRNEEILRLFTYGAESCQKLYDEFHPKLKELYFTRTYETGDLTSLTMTSPKTSKGKAVLEMASSLGISPEEVACFGDSESDLTMVDVVGVGVLMKNSAPGLLEKAKHVALSNREHGVAKFIRDHWL